MSRRFGRFVPTSTITARMDRKDLRFQAAARAKLPSFLQPEVIPFVDVVLIPAHPEAPLAPVVEVELRPVQDGDACSAACGHCGRCSSGPAMNAVCEVCGDSFSKGRDDIGSLCDGCCGLRDALQERLTAIGLRHVRAALAKNVEVA